MENIECKIHARWIVPIEPAEKAYDNYCLAVEQGNILELLPSVEADKKYRANEVHHLNQHVLLPGLVNTHGHSPMTLFRGLADDLPLATWLQDHIWPAESRWVGDEFVKDGSRLAIAEMLKSGTTCFCDMYFFPEETKNVVRETHIRAVLGLIMIDFPSAYAQDADEYLNKGVQLHDDLRNSELITTMFAPHAPYTVSDTALEKIRSFADEMDIPITMHVHETAQEVKEAADTMGVRPLQRLKDLGLVSPRLIAVHMTQLNEDEIQMLAETGAHVAHCPESNLKMASGFCPVLELMNAGVNVTLGTDGAASNNDLDMIGEMRTAALLAKGLSGDATSLPAHQVLRMATLNGAKALGLDDRIGSLEPGKAADIIAVDLSALNTQPVYDPVSQLVYAAQSQQCSHVWVNGELLMKDRQLLRMDESHLLQTAAAWHDKIVQHRKTSVPAN